MIEKKFDKKNCKVTFILDKGDFSEFDDIRVLGDFNGWHYEKGLIMELKKNQFKGSASLKAGTNYEFRYILNGRHWFNDPQADGLVDSPFYGISNTLIVIGETLEEGTKESKPVVAKTVKVTAPKKTIPSVQEEPVAEVKPAKKVAVKSAEVKVAAPKKVTEKSTEVKVAAPKKVAVKSAEVKVVAPKKVAEKSAEVKVVAPKKVAEKKLK
jgi:hypothetical protein